MGLLDKIKEQASNLQQLANTSGMINSQNSTPPSPSVEQQSMPQQNVEKNSLYGNYMEQLIEMALADGELTEKEKQVLFKKAEAAGIDLDEFEMVLDARLYERKKVTQAVQSNTQGAAPKSDRYGDVKKCPNCGAIIETFVTRCADCGHEFRNIGIVSSFNLLSSKLEALDKQKTGSFWGIKDQSIDEKKCSLIKNFPIPTTKEDILEFLTMGAPLANDGNFAERLAPKRLPQAWKSKCNQVIMKARFSMKDDKGLMAEIDKYDQLINANAIDKAMNQVNKVFGIFKK